MEQIVDGLGKIVEGINSVDAAIDSNRVNEIIYIKINTEIILIIHCLLENTIKCGNININRDKHLLIHINL